MEKIIHAIFNAEEEALQAKQKLDELDEHGDISLAEYYLISKDANGNPRITSGQGQVLENLDSTMGGALVGTLFGLLGGPMGLLIGAGEGALAGYTGDLIRDDYKSNYLTEVKENLPNGKTVIVAHVDESAETPINTSLEPFGAAIHRLDFKEQVEKAIQKDWEDINRKLEEAERSLEKAADERKATINKDIEELKTKRQALASKINQKRELQKQQYQNWIDRQQAKLEAWKAQVHGRIDDERRERLEKRIAHHEEKLAELKGEYATL